MQRKDNTRRSNKVDLCECEEQIVVGGPAKRPGANDVFVDTHVPGRACSPDNATAENLHRLRWDDDIRLEILENTRLCPPLVFLADDAFVLAHVAGVIEAAHDGREQAQDHGKDQGQDQAQGAHVAEQFLAHQRGDVIGHGENDVGQGEQWQVD